MNSEILCHLLMALSLVAGGVPIGDAGIDIGDGRYTLSANSQKSRRLRALFERLEAFRARTPVRVGIRRYHAGHIVGSRSPPFRRYDARREACADMSKTEWWQRGAIEAVPAVLQPVAHILLQVRDSVGELVENLTLDEWNARPAGVASAAFHVRHIAGVIDRLFTLRAW